MTRKAQSKSMVEAVPQVAGVLCFALYFVPALRAAAAWTACLAIPCLISFLIYQITVSPPQFRPAAPTQLAPPQVASGDTSIIPRVQWLPETLRRMDWFQFEKLVAVLYRTDGYSVTRLGGARPDGAVELVLERDGVQTLVQCRHWKARELTEKEFRNFHRVLTDTAMAAGWLVTLRSCSKPAEQFARRNNIALVGETGLICLLKKANWRTNPEIQALLDDRRKFCPLCESPMEQRTATEGWRAGQTFWCCSTYPRCLHTQEEF